MITFIHHKTGIRIHHNGDYSGDAIISLPASVGTYERTARGHIEVTLPASALVDQPQPWSISLSPGRVLISGGYRPND